MAASGELVATTVVNSLLAGSGRAVIEGGTPITGWKRCASAEEAKGNAHWKDIFYADIPKPGNWFNMNLCDGEKPLPIADSTSTTVRRRPCRPRFSK